MIRLSHQVATRLGLDNNALDESGVGSDLQKIELDDNCRRLIRLLLFSIDKTAGVGGGNAKSIVNAQLGTLLGDEFVQSVQPDAADHVRFDGEPLGGYSPSGKTAVDPDATVPELGMMTMSLDRLSLNDQVRRIFFEGKCSTADLTRMSLASTSAAEKKVFVHSRSKVPARSFSDGPQQIEQEVERMAHRAHGGKA